MIRTIKSNLNMSDNKSKSTSKKGEQKKNKQHPSESEKKVESEENDYGGLPSRKPGKNLGCGG
jgi:hypothetical protein